MVATCQRLLRIVRAGQRDVEKGGKLHDNCPGSPIPAAPIPRRRLKGHPIGRNTVGFLLPIPSSSPVSTQVPDLPIAGINVSSCPERTLFSSPEPSRPQPPPPEVGGSPVRSPTMSCRLPARVGVRARARAIVFPLVRKNRRKLQVASRKPARTSASHGLRTSVRGGKWKRLLVVSPPPAKAGGSPSVRIGVYSGTGAEAPCSSPKTQDARLSSVAACRAAASSGLFDG